MGKATHVFIILIGLWRYSEVSTSWNRSRCLMRRRKHVLKKSAKSHSSNTSCCYFCTSITTTKLQITVITVIWFWHELEADGRKKKKKKKKKKSGNCELQCKTRCVTRQQRYKSVCLWLPAALWCFRCIIDAFHIIYFAGFLNYCVNKKKCVRNKKPVNTIWCSWREAECRVGHTCELLPKILKT